MQLKSSFSKLGVAAATVLAVAAVIAGASAASPKTFKLGVRLADGAYCATQIGAYKYTASADISTSGLMPSLWATDTNGYDPDCMHLDLQVGTKEVTSDFRVCLQFADSVALNGDGTIRSLSQVGTMECTPWASDGGGWSKAAMDSNKYDWDTVQVAIETRALPAGAVITDYRVGGRLCDHRCTTQFGTTQYTPWASAGGGKSAWFSDENWYDSDGGQLILEINNETGCKEPIPASQQIGLTTEGSSLRGGFGDSGAPSGWFTVPTSSVITSLTLKNGFNDRMVELFAWTGTKNFFTGGDIVRVPYAGNQQIVNCPQNHAVVGLDLYRGGGDKHETALLCRPVVSGSIDLGAAKEYSINGCGQKYCTPYYNFPTTGVVMIGGRFNTDSHKYLGSIVVAPIKTATQRQVACPTEPTCVAGGRQLTSPMVTSEATSVKAAGQVIGMECIDNKLPIAVATAYSSKKIVAGTCAATTPGFFSSTNRTFVPFANYDKDYRCAAGSVVTRFVEGGMMCQPISGGEGSLLMATARKVAIGSGNAVNNYFSLAQSGSNKVWAPIGIEYQAGSPQPKSVTVVEVNTAPSCTQLPPPVVGALSVHRFIRNANGTPGQPALSTKAGLNASNLVSAMPAVFLQLAPGPYPAYVTDLPGEEQFGFCSFNVGGNPCAPSSFAPIPAGLCSAGTCQVPPTNVAGGKVAAVVVTYASTTPVVPPPPPIPDPAPEPDPDPAVATCTLTATPAAIVVNVGSSKLEWNCTGSGSVTISATDNPAFTSVQNLPMQGSLNVSPDRTTTFKVTSSGASATAMVTVGGSTIDENWDF